jgi:hypothetical protein
MTSEHVLINKWLVSFKNAFTFYLGLLGKALTKIFSFQMYLHTTCCPPATGWAGLH